MTKALSVSQRQAQALLRAADAEHAIIEVKLGDAVLRLIPASLAQDRKTVDQPVNPENFESLDDYLAWRDRENARKD